MSSLPQNWKDWVLKGLLQGSDSMDILTILLQNGFTFEASKKALGNNLPDGVSCNKDGPFYARVANPKLLSNLEHYNATVIDDERVQLIKIDNFFSDKQCDDVIALAEANLRPSEIPARPDEEQYKGFRTSSTCDLPFTKDPLSSEIDAFIVDALGLGVGEKETIQAQHYAIGQQFKAHYDYFVPGSKDFLTYRHQGGQRTWTIMVYLNEECEGGQTEFVELGISFKPQKGTALVWNNLNVDGTPNHFTMHQAHPVVSGEKMVITKWFREDAYEPLNSGKTD